MANGFWTEKNYEPKRKFRFQLDLPQAGINSWVVKKVDKPSWTSDNLEHRFLNHTFKYPGRIKWDDISVTLIDSDDPHTSALLYNILAASGYPLPPQGTNTDLNFDQVAATTIGKTAATGQLGVVSIFQYSGEGGGVTGGATETWTLHNAFIKDCKFGDLDYESEDMVEITLALTYDWAVLSTAT